MKLIVNQKIDHILKKNQMIEIGKTLKCIITNIQMTHNKVFLDCIKKRNLDNNETMNQDNNGKI